MVLMAICGNLGSGKTISATYLAYRNYLKGKKIYSNYWLAFPHVRVTRISQLENMVTGFATLDELWNWIDARVSGSKKNRAISKILLSSRKRGIHFCYTTQSFRQTDVRIRNITDFIAEPVMSQNETWCILNVYSYPLLQKIKSYKFSVSKIGQLYNTNEIVGDVLD